ncbi:long-chain fatty acid transport protein, outer membrane protein [Rufibacter radiotolerans]|uniref:Long-chain fatty acid transport protein, outer membrane protein n=1 Tax=Rufibacter radiotolerans TaxID=1379910 RepID=A0A0H4W9M2_9BACT|nr:OmpP1/FadL family transporter [Rufibacter radiotolerans]AKQ47156.1 long-chain fatty acid transport protein, outer membrane protein [Rufibacter radiotolerans]
MKSKLLAFLGCAMLSAGVANAGGFQANLQGQKQLGMGHTGTGLALDQSSIFFNPGALAHLRQNGIQLGVSALNSKIAYREPFPGVSEAQTDNKISTPFQVYASFGKEDSPLRFGIGIYTPYGSSVNWGDTWQGRFGLNELTLQAIFIQPTISYQVNDKIGIGAGFVYSTGKVNLQRSIPLISSNGVESGLELDGAASGMGFNVGVFFKPTDKLSLGLTYRSKVEMEVKEGDVTFTLPTAPVLAPSFTATQFDATLPLPANITLGVGFKPTDKLTIAVDLQRVQWSAYKSLRFDFNGNAGGPGVTSSESPRNYEDVFIYRLGLQYQVSDILTVRAGGYYDQSPVQSGYLTPETPDADSRGVSTGLTLALSEKVDLDASFLYINKKERTDDAKGSGGVPGTFKSIAYIPGVGLNYKF